jgi:hypothetical protein
VLLAVGVPMALAQEPRVRIMTDTFQMQVPPPPPGAHFEFGGQIVDFVKSEMAFHARVVKGAPYSAEAVTESTQTLADGNRIRRTTKAVFYRDSLGRTRREQTLGEVGPLVTSGEPLRTIFINDPVAGASYMLNSRDHSAHKIPAAGDMRGQIEMREAKLKAEAGVKAVAKGREGENHVFVHQMGQGPNVFVQQMTKKMEGAARNQVKEESLGVQTIEGVACDGTRSTMTIPAGTIGNERPIEVVTERWYSTQLQTMVMTKTTDPRFGETVYRLSNLKLEEQAESLFSVPADYTVRSETR